MFKNLKGDKVCRGNNRGKISMEKIKLDHVPAHQIPAICLAHVYLFFLFFSSHQFVRGLKTPSIEIQKRDMSPNTKFFAIRCHHFMSD